MPPKRTSERTSRPSSRKAAPTASAVRKATKATARAAVTRGLIPRATATLAQVSEVEDRVAEQPAEQAALAPAPEPALQHPFTYKLQWRAMLDARTQLHAMFAYRQSNMLDTSLQKVEEWFQQFVEEMPNYKIVRTTVAAAYAALPVSVRLSASYNLESYTLMLTELAEYERHGKIGLAIHVTS